MGPPTARSEISSKLIELENLVKKTNRLKSSTDKEQRRSDKADEKILHLTSAITEKRDQMGSYVPVAKGCTKKLGAATASQENKKILLNLKEKIAHKCDLQILENNLLVAENEEIKHEVDELRRAELDFQNNVKRLRKELERRKALVAHQSNQIDKW
jgi:hypothetical protein